MNNQLLHLMHLVSPALPVGAYAYSQGLEYAVDSGWLAEPGKLQQWITGVLEHSVGHLDLPVLLRLYRAWDAAALDEVDQWNDFVRANRETAELLLEDEQLGLALQRLSVSLQTKGADTPLSSPPCFITQFALAGVRRHIAEEDLLYGFAWSWLENQVAAATKIVPLGQTQAQQTLVAMMEKIPAVCAHALTLQDEELGVGLPALAMASSRHERQYSRLFRS